MIVKILGDGLQVIILKNTQRWALEKHSLFSRLNKIYIEKILDCLQIFNYKAGDVISNKTSECRKLIIVMEGAIRYKNNIIEKGNVFGDNDYFFGEKKKQLYIL